MPWILKLLAWTCLLFYKKIFNFLMKHPLLWEQMWYEVITRLENPFFLSLSFHSQPFDLILHFIYVVKYFISSYLLLPLSSNLSFNIILFICIYICMVILFMKVCAMILKKLLSFSLITSHCLFFISLWISQYCLRQAQVILYLTFPINWVSGKEKTCVSIYYVDTNQFISRYCWLWLSLSRNIITSYGI